MKRQLFHLIVFSTLFIVDQPLFAQESFGEFDQVFISKPKISKFLYEIQDPKIAAITIKDKKTKRSPVSSGEVLGDAGRGALALFAGGLFTFGSSTDVFWNVRGELICNNEEMNWEVSLFCPGVLEKNKQRVSNDDGSYSVDTEKMAYLNWHKESTGIILEKGDTIGRFIIIMDPRTNPLVSQWNIAPYRDQPSRYNPEVKKIFGMSFNTNLSVDFGIIGKLRGQNFVLLYNGDLWQSWLFDQDRLRMIFDADIDDLPMITKKDRLVPLLKLNQPFTDIEKHDLIRLAMVSRFMAKNVNQEVEEL